MNNPGILHGGNHNTQDRFVGIPEGEKLFGRYGLGEDSSNT
jgi:hypothetical protein